MKIEKLIDFLIPLKDLEVKIFVATSDNQSWDELDKLDEIRVDGKYLIEPRVGFQVTPFKVSEDAPSTIEVVCPHCKVHIMDIEIPNQLDGVEPPQIKEGYCGNCDSMFSIKFNLPKNRLN